MDASWEEAFRSQHMDSFMTLEPTAVIGKLSEARSYAAKHFAGSAKGDVTIRVIGD